jgi:hypothetical protein
VGTWTGEGLGQYPTIQSFAYCEEVRFTHVGKPHLAYAQRTWSPQDEIPLHSEVGYWRPLSDGGLEVVLAHPFGVVEISEGRVDGSELEVNSRALLATTTGSEVDAIRRRVRIEGDQLIYTVDMAASGQRLQRHLRAELRRKE